LTRKVARGYDEEKELAIIELTPQQQQALDAPEQPPLAEFAGVFAEYRRRVDPDRDYL
jgi:hypothetical protein